MIEICFSSMAARRIPLNGYIYPDSETDSIEKLPYHAIFMGHTHRAFIKKAGEKNIVNVGSCGLPRDAGNKLTVVLYDTIKNEAYYKEFEMNVAEVIKNVCFQNSSGCN